MQQRLLEAWDIAAHGYETTGSPVPAAICRDTALTRTEPGIAEQLHQSSLGGSIVSVKSVGSPRS